MTTSKLEITLFGSPHFRLNGKPVESFATRKAQALLIYLVYNNRPFLRDLLATMFWAEKSDADARNNLRRVLPDLRKQFGDYLVGDRQTLMFERHQPFWLDVEEFTAAMRRMRRSSALADPDIDTLEAALARYTGEFLAGFNLSEAPEFEDWVTFNREHLREEALRGLSFVIEHFVQTRQIQRGLAASQRLLALEPWHETGYQQRMILLAWNGERGAALQHYETCKRMLADEFGLDPGDETTELYARIKAGEFDPLVPPVQVAAQPNAVTPGLDDVPRQPIFVGRTAELRRLREWHVAQHCAVVAVLGVGGAGKTSLVAQYVRSSAEDAAIPPPFDHVLWASLLNAPPLASLLRIWLRALSAQTAAAFGDDVDELLARLFPHLRGQRCLLVLDNMESIMQEGGEHGHFRSDYKEYGLLLQRLVELSHSSTLVITSRELPAVLARNAGSASSVRTLALPGLSAASGAELLAFAGLAQASPAIDELVHHYSGNPLALRLVADTVRDLYGGDLNAFLAHGLPVFGDIRTVLDEQTARLTDLEREILGWLAIEREPVGVNKVLESLVGPLDRHAILHATNTLLHTSLVERDERQDGAGPVRLTLQNVVMEYMTDRLLRAFDDDLVHGTGATFQRYPLLLAGAPEYVQASQRRLLVQRVADQARARWEQAGAIERLYRLLAKLRQDGLASAGYGAANALHLLLALGAELRGLDLSRMAVRQADLRQATLAGVNFTGADLSGSVFASTIGTVESVAVSPDGCSVVAAGSDGVIYLWRADDSELVNTLHRHTVVTTVTFSTDGRLLLSSGLDGLLCVWDVASATLVSSLAMPELPVICAALHPGGTLVAAACTDEMIRIWDWRSGAVSRLLHAPSVLAGLAFSPDGETLVSVGDERTICIWDAHDGTLRQTRYGHTGKVEAVAIHPAGSTFATGGEDGRICLWDMGDTALLHTLDGHTDFVLWLAFSPDGALLVSCGADQTARVWNVASGALRRVLTGHRGWVNTAAFAAHGRSVLTGGYDQSVRMWDVQSGRLEHVLKGHLRWVDSVTFSNDGHLLASCSLDGPVRLWDAETGELLHTLRGPEAATRILAFTRRGDLLAAAGDDQKVRIWDVRSGALLRTLLGHAGSVRNALFSPDGRVLISAGHDGTLRSWEVATGQAIRVVANVSAANRLAIAFEPNSQMLAYGTRDNVVVLEAIATGEIERILPAGNTMPSVVAFDRTGRWLACGSNDGAILIYDLADRTMPATPYYDVPATGAPVWRLLFSPDSSTLAWGRTDQRVQVLHLASKRTGATLLTYFGAFCLGFGGSGEDLIADGPDHTLLVRDTQSGALHQTLRGHAASVTCIEVSPRGDCVASSSGDGSIRLWDLTTGACRATLEALGPYAGMAITGVKGITPAQRASLLQLGAQE